MGLADAVAQLEAEIGVDFAKDEGARFTHRARIDAPVGDALATHTLAECAAVFDCTGCTWSIYRSLSQALTDDPRLFAGNPIFSGVAHAGGAAYPTAGSTVHIPKDRRHPAKASPHIGEHGDEVLATLLGMGAGEIGSLHDRGLVA